MNIFLLAGIVVGIAYAGSLFRAHPLWPISLFLFVFVVALLTSCAPDHFGDGKAQKILTYSLIALIVLAGACALDYTKGVAHIEKLFFDGKVRHYEDDVDTDDGPTTVTAYYLDEVDPTADTFIVPPMGCYCLHFHTGSTVCAKRQEGNGSNSRPANWTKPPRERT